MKDRPIFLRGRGAVRYSMAGLDSPSSPIIYPRERPRPGLRLWIFIVCVVTFALMLATRSPAEPDDAFGSSPTAVLPASTALVGAGSLGGEGRP